MEAFLETMTHLHPDPSWSWWITLLYRNWHIAVNLIMPYTVSLPTQISETLVLENLKLFSPGHVSMNQSKQAFSHFEIYAPHWQRDYAPNGISIWHPLIWNFATQIFKEMFSKYQSIGPSGNFWMNTDLNGASGSTTTSNLLGSYQVLHSLSYCDFVAIKFVKVLSYRNFIRRPDRGKKTVRFHHHLDQVLIANMSCYIFASSFDLLPRQRLYLVYLLLLYWSWLAHICSLSFWFSQLYSSDGFTHGAQARRNRGGLGMAFDLEPWNFFHPSWCKTRLPGFWFECHWSSRSYDLDPFGISWSNYYTQWPRHYDTNGHIFSSNATCCTFPDTGELHLQCFSSRSLLLTSGPPDSLQDLYSLKQHQGVIHWRDSNLGNLQMSWSWTLFLRSLRQLGVVFTDCGLLAPSLWASSTTWAQPFPQCPRWDDLFSWWTWPDHQDPGLGQTIIRHSDGCYGIWGTQRDMEDGWSHELPRRDPNPSTSCEFLFWIKWSAVCTLAFYRFTSTCVSPNPHAMLFQNQTSLWRGVCVCLICKDVKLQFLSN